MIKAEFMEELLYWIALDFNGALTKWWLSWNTDTEKLLD